MSDTPRTDEEIAHRIDKLTVRTGFARQLERDLNEQTLRANDYEERETDALRDLAAMTAERDALRTTPIAQQVDELRADNERLRERIKETAGRLAALEEVREMVARQATVYGVGGIVPAAAIKINVIDFIDALIAKEKR